MGFKYFFFQTRNVVSIIERTYVKVGVAAVDLGDRRAVVTSVDVQATEGLMGKILLCMYAQKAYVSCTFTCLSTSNACWLIYNRYDQPDLTKTCQHDIDR